MNQYAHRLSECTLTLKDAKGLPMPGRKVQVELTNHEFLFGTGNFWLQILLDPETPAPVKEKLEKYWEVWSKVFNYATLPFYQGRYEPTEGVTREETTLRAAKYLKERGFTVKGHPLCWHTASALWLLEKDNKAVLENPDSISRTVLSKGLDAGTAYEILSIDIADVDVGRNVGAQLMMDQAEADRRIAQARAEERRAMAVAHEQEMKASVQEMRARVVEAEAEVPKAMAAALREGKLGVMDYFQMKNVEADTSMREGIAKAAAPSSSPAPADKK